MTSDRLTIWDRLEHSAINGRTSANLNLYIGQQRKLLKDGFAVKQISSDPIRHGQHSCNIDWSEASVDTAAHDLLEIALRVKSKKESEEAGKVKPPYCY